MASKLNFKYLLEVVLISLVLLLIFSFILIHNFSKRNEPVVLYYVDNITAIHRELINEFNKQYKNRIFVKTINLPFSKFSTNERKELIARALRSKNKHIDIFTVDLIWVKRFARWAYPLDNDLKELFNDKVIDVAKKSCIVDRKLVAFPFYIDLSLMYYRKDILEKFSDYQEIKNKLDRGITWNEFIDLGKRFTKQKQYFYIFPGRNFEGLMCWFWEGLCNKYRYENGRIIFDYAYARRSLKLHRDLIYHYKMTPYDVVFFDEVNGYIYALENDIPFFRGWPGFLKHHKDLVNIKCDINNFDFCLLPHFEDCQSGYTFGGWNFMISKFSEHKKEAAEFVKFMFQKSSQLYSFDVGGYIPVNKEVFDEYMESNDELKKANNLLKHGIHRPYSEEYTKYSDIFAYFINLYLKNNSITEDEVIDSINFYLNKDELFTR